MQIDLNLMPLFNGVGEASVGTLVTGPNGFGIAELLFFLATYLWELVEGGGGASLGSVLL